MAVATLKDLQDLFYTITVGVTGLPANCVRHAYQPNGQPAWDKAQNLAFINILPVDNPYDKQRNIIWRGDADNQIEQSISYTRVIAVDWVFYGSESYDNADAVKAGILYEPTREPMAALNVYPLTEIQAPRRAPYEFNSTWWERTDLRVLFNVGTERVANVPRFEEFNITVQESAGPDILITIPVE